MKPPNFLRPIWTLYLLTLAAMPASAAFPNGYGYCKVVSTQHAMVSGTSDLTNFPLTVILTDNDLRTTANGGLVNNTSGYDIGFYPDCSGSGAALKWEMESYSPTTGAVVAHVLRPTLSHLVDDTIGIYYGGSFSTFQGNAASVWNSNYKLVAHLPNGSSLTATDSTSSGLGNGIITAATATTGKMDGGANFVAASSSQIDFGSPDFSSYGAFTASMWIKASSVVGTILTQWSDIGTNSAFILDHNGGSGKARGYVSTSSNQQYGINGVTNVADGNWHYLALTWSASGALERLYVDGLQEGSIATTGPVLKNASASHLWLGRYTQNLPYTGSVDEVRISNTARSADWVLTEYRNQSSPATYTSAGPRITPGGEPAMARHTVRGGV